MQKILKIMLSRRILRIKAFKVVYSLLENPAMSRQEAEAELERSCESTRDLYLFLMSLICPLTSEASARIEAARSKFHPTEEERNPNLKFVSNAIAPILSDDSDMQKLLKKKKFSWDQYDAFLRHLYESVREKDYFKEYMADPSTSLKEDAALFVKIFEQELDDNDELSDILEDMSIYWNDDVAYALTWCCRSVESLGKGRRWVWPELYQSDMPGNEDRESDKAFVVNIVRTAVRNVDKYTASVAEITPKWDKNRICTTDLALIISGLSEAEAFPHIGSRTTINEYVEISKYYSTPESSSFVNGILDKLINKK